MKRTITIAAFALLCATGVRAEGTFILDGYKVTLAEVQQRARADAENAQLNLLNQLARFEGYLYGCSMRERTRLNATMREYMATLYEYLPENAKAYVTQGERQHYRTHIEGAGETYVSAYCSSLTVQLAPWLELVPVTQK